MLIIDHLLTTALLLIDIGASINFKLEVLSGLSASMLTFSPGEIVRATGSPHPARFGVTELVRASYRGLK